MLNALLAATNLHHVAHDAAAHAGDAHHAVQAALLTFVVAAFTGVLLLLVANRIRISAIVLLLIGGILVGPQVLGLVTPTDLGSGLQVIIGIAVALILFEGGLTLDVQGYRQVWREIWGVMTIGVIVTWLGGALILRLAFDFEWRFCLLAGSLVIVTGPTVIGPLLQRIRVNKRLHHILHWEGVLIDPVGVFIALLCFEYYISVDGETMMVLQDFLKRFAVGGILGLVFGQALTWVLKSDFVHEEHVNVLALVAAMLNFGIADFIVAESGLLSVTIAGLVIGIQKPPRIRNIIHYKEEMRDLLIGLLFILLAANLKLERFTEYGWKLAAVVLALMFIIRPLNIFASLARSKLTFRERAFLSYVAPRGIVAASMASIVALRLADQGEENAFFLEAWVYSVIAATVIFQGFTAGWVGKLLGVVEPKPTGWMVIGAHRVGRAVAKFIEDQDESVVVVDTNAREVREARRAGLTALAEDAMTLDPELHVQLYGCGRILALTPNEELNRLLCRRWGEEIKGADLYRWERKKKNEDAHNSAEGQGLWSGLQLERWMAAGDEPIPLKSGKRKLGNVKADHLLMLADSSKKILTRRPEDHVDEPLPALVFEAFRAGKAAGLPISRERVVTGEFASLRALYEAMLITMATQLAHLDREALLDGMVAREEDYASLLGNGIAMPHARISGVSNSLLAVGRPDTPVKGEMADDEITLVFMLLSPEDQPSLHLSHISAVARMIGTEQGRKALTQAPDAASLYDIISQG